MLEVSDLSFKYPSSGAIFDRLSLNLPSKGLVHLQGANGSGKSTLLKIISCLITPHQGLIKFNNEEISIRDVNYLSPGEAQFFDQVTGQEGIDLFCRLNQTELNKSRVSLFDTDPLYQKVLESQFFRMSSGMKRLLLLMICFSKEVPIYLLDEPFVGVDKERKDHLLKILKDISKDCLIIMTTHQEQLNLETDHIINLKDLKEKNSVP